MSPACNKAVHWVAPVAAAARYKAAVRPLPKSVTVAGARLHTDTMISASPPIVS